MTEPTVHLRRTGDEDHTWCGLTRAEARETMSLEFTQDHVLPNRKTCCTTLFDRLCDACLEGVHLQQA